MSDGGVVTCMPLLNIMDKLPVVEEKTLCGGNSDTKVAASSISTNNKLPESQPAKPSASQPPKKKKIVKVIRKVVRRKPKERKDQDKKSEVLQGKGCNKEENGGDSGFKDEVEEGELNSHADLETGEISPVKSLRNSEIEKGEISGDCSNLQYDKSYVERRDLPADKYRKEEREIRSWRDPGDEIEKGEFIPDRWHKMDTRKDDHSYNRSRRSGVDRETTWKYDYDYEHERTPPGGRFSNEDTYRRREFRSGNDRATRVSSKIVIEESLHNNDPNNLGKEYSSTVNKLKRHGAEHLYADHGDYGSSKYRKLSDDCSRSLHPNHYSRNSVERDYRDSYSSKNSSLEKYPKKHHDSYFRARAVSDRHGARSDLSPHDRSRYHGHRDRSSHNRERSPYARERSPYIFEKPSHARKRSPHDRSHHHDCRRSPSYSEWSSDRRDGTSKYMEDPQSDRTRRNGHRDISRKSGVRERRDSQTGMELENKQRHRDSNGKESTPSRKELQGKNILNNNNPVVEKNSVCDSSKIPSACAKGKESVQVGEATTEELPSMEVDMDICDTPPHEEPMAADSSLGEWFYLDYYGTEHGPAKLSELKALVEQGILFSDHMIKHSDNNRWVTIENATSPVVNINIPSIVSDAVTRLVNPPEAPGNLLEDIADAVKAVHMEQGAEDSLPESLSIPDSNDTVVGHHEDFQFDNRIASLLDGYTIIPGRELETLGEAVQIKVELEETRRFVSSEDIIWCYYQVVNQLLLNEESWERSEPKAMAIEESKSENVDCSESDEIGSWFSGRWSCTGGDWIRHDEAFQDRDYKKKMVLNDGFPLCLMQKSGYEDPRWHHKDDLYNPRSRSRLELPLWAFSGVDERNQARGVKASVLSVVRLNSLVVNDPVPSVPDPLVKVRGGEKFSSRHARPSPASSDSKRDSVESISQSSACGSQDMQGFWRTDASVSTPGAPSNFETRSFVEGDDAMERLLQPPSSSTISSPKFPSRASPFLPRLRSSTLGFLSSRRVSSVSCSSFWNQSACTPKRCNLAINSLNGPPSSRESKPNPGSLQRIVGAVSEKRKTLSTGTVILISAVAALLLNPLLAPPAFASFQTAAKTGWLASAWTGFLAGCLHTLSGPDHLAALAPLSIGRTKMESAAVGALWGCGHDAGQVIFGLLFLLLKDRLHIEVLQTWGTRIVGLTLVIIGAMGIKEASEAPEPCVALETDMSGMVPTEKEALSPPLPKKKKIGFATFATGVVHGLQPDALMIVLPALALPSRIAGSAFLIMFLVGTVVAMGSYTAFIGSCSEALKEKVPRITEKLTWVSSLVAIGLGLGIVISPFFGFSLY